MPEHADERHGKRDLAPAQGEWVRGLAQLRRGSREHAPRRLDGDTAPRRRRSPPMRAATSRVRRPKWAPASTRGRAGKTVHRDKNADPRTRRRAALDRRQRSFRLVLDRHVGGIFLHDFRFEEARVRVFPAATNRRSITGEDADRVEGRTIVADRRTCRGEAAAPAFSRSGSVSAAAYADVL